MQIAKSRNRHFPVPAFLCTFCFILLRCAGHHSVVKTHGIHSAGTVFRGTDFRDRHAFCQQCNASAYHAHSHLFAAADYRDPFSLPADAHACAFSGTVRSACPFDQAVIPRLICPDVLRLGGQPAAVRISASAARATGTFSVLHSTMAAAPSSGDQAICDETPGRLPPWR